MSAEEMVFDDETAKPLSEPPISFDPADPFAFLSTLPPSSMSSPPSSSNDDSSQSSSPPADWSQFSTLWDPAFVDPDLDQVVQPSAPAPGTVKPGDMPVDIFASLPMDLDAFDFSAATGLSINPASLQFDPKLFVAPPTSPAFLAPSAFTGRRLSVTSSSSSSGASLSPVMEFQPAAAPLLPPTGAAILEPPIVATDPASELAQRVRLAAGVTLAVPAQALLQANAQKLPIPRLPRPGMPGAQVPKSSPPTSSASSPQSSFTPASPSPPPSSGPPSLAQQQTSSGPRTKTSHTTIERRYRTNLNARIQGLKDAVPALRVLERRKERERLGQSWTVDDDGSDLVDARGYADGVKVARKVSKANVLGKAAEYIRVLKRREARMKREQEGLRALVNGLVGGPALLKEWEAAWTARFGGAERDELEYEGMSDDEGDDEDDEDEDDGRARKRAKVAPAASQTAKEKKERKTAAQPAAPGEKRKRGRPRKVPDQPTPSSTPMQEDVRAEVPQPVIAASAQTQGGQYLLAAFAFFSFFNTPLRSSPPSHHAHTGSVISSIPAPAPVDRWADFVGAFHLFVSVLVFFSIVLPWLPRFGLGLKAPIGFLRKIKAASTVENQGTAQTGAHKDAFNRVALLDALAPAARGTPDEPARLRAALGVYTGVTGVIVRILGKATRSRRADRGIERLQLEQRAWVRLGERAALDPRTRLGVRIQSYLGMLSHTPAFAASPSDLATLALLVRPVAPAKAAGLWEKARTARVVRGHEKRVLERMELSEAATRLRSPSTGALMDCSPLNVLGVLCAREDTRKCGGKLLVSATLLKAPETQARETVDVLRALGGREAVLATALERLADPRPVTISEAESLVRTLGGEAARGEELLLSVIARVRALFPPSASGTIVEESVEVKRARGALRRALGDEVFEGSDIDGIEEARDRGVDLVVEAERTARRGKSL